MCASCINTKDPNAPSAQELIADIKRKLRQQRVALWIARACAAFDGVWVCISTVWTLDGEPYLGLSVIVFLLLAWWMLRTAEKLAYKVDHTAYHLRITKALLISGAQVHQQEPNANDS